MGNSLHTHQDTHPSPAGPSVRAAFAAEARSVRWQPSLCCRNTCFDSARPPQDWALNRGRSSRRKNSREGGGCLPLGKRKQESFGCLRWQLMVGQSVLTNTESCLCSSVSVSVQCVLFAVIECNKSVRFSQPGCSKEFRFHCRMSSCLMSSCLDALDSLNSGVVRRGWGSEPRQVTHAGE